MTVIYSNRSSDERCFIYRGFLIGVQIVMEISPAYSRAMEWIQFESAISFHTIFILVWELIADSNWIHLYRDVCNYYLLLSYVAMEACINMLIGPKYWTR